MQFRLSLVLLFLATTFAHAQSPAGDWLGTLDAGVVKLRLAFHLQVGPQGLTGTMDSLDQNARGIPIQSGSLAGDRVILVLSMGRFEGKLNPAADVIEGTWLQGGASLPLTVHRITDVSALQPRRPQNPTKPYPYREEDVAYENKQANVRLAGTLTVPEGKGPYPAALLITGSGPQDRDESLMGHKPFLVLADYLTRRGIAVLRVDDRGIGKSTGNFAAATTADFATDVQAGVAYLKSRAQIDSKRIGLIGHSEGGVIAPMVAAHDPSIAFIVLMAGSAVPGDQLIVAQVAAIASANGASDENVATTVAEEQKILNIVKGEPDPAEAEKRIRAELAGKVPEGQIAAQIRALLSPWYRYFLSYDPGPALRQVKCPVLAINGGNDLQVPAAQNLPAIRQALAQGGNKNFEVLELPGLNHLFQTSKTGQVSEYGEIEETISPKALSTIADWIVRQVLSQSMNAGSKARN